MTETEETTPQTQPDGEEQESKPKKKGPGRPAGSGKTKKAAKEKKEKKPQWDLNACEFIVTAPIEGEDGRVAVEITDYSGLPSIINHYKKLPGVQDGDVTVNIMGPAVLVKGLVLDLEIVDGE